VEKPTELQGESFRELVAKKTTQWRDAIYYTYYEYPSVHMVKRHYGIRTERYKLMHFYYDIDEWELYDLEKDPSEMVNVYNNPEYQTVQEELHNRLSELRTHYGDSDSLDQIHIDRYVTKLKR
jgi:arylsulfatase A-like enzyme